MGVELSISAFLLFLITLNHSTLHHLTSAALSSVVKNYLIPLHLFFSLVSLVAPLPEPHPLPPQSYIAVLDNNPNPTANMVSRALNLILRGLQFLFILIVMALIGSMIAQADNGNPATVNYNMFVAVFAMLSLFYLIAAAWSDSFTGHPLIPIVLDALNTLFIFAGATALAAGLGVHSCSNGVSALYSVLNIC